MPRKKKREWRDPQEVIERAKKRLEKEIAREERELARREKDKKTLEQLEKLEKGGLVVSRLPKAPPELNDKQVAIIYMMVDPNLRKLSDKEKCEKVGISRATLWKWKHNPVFMKYYLECRNVTLRTVGHRIDSALINKCLKGDVAAMKLYYQLTGELFDRREIKAEVALHAHLDVEQTELVKNLLTDDTIDVQFEEK